MKRFLVVSAGLAVVALAVVAWLWWRSPPVAPPAPLREVSLQATAVLPTLDTPIPEGKSALWCASFQLAWERLKADVTGGPVRLAGAHEVTRRLNDAPSVADTVDEKDTIAAAGLARDGIAERVRREMRRRFPEASPPDGEGPPDGALAYAYLRAAVKFTHPFLENEIPLEFVAADGTNTPVTSFGLPYGVRSRSAVSQQIEILHATRDRRFRLEAFVIDLCKYTSPYQVLVARLPRKQTLGAMLADMEARLAGPNDEELTKPLRVTDSMEIPHIRFRVAHHFKELEGQTMPDQGITLVLALQRIDFRLDARGVTLKSDSIIIPKAAPRRFHGNQPFLLVLRKRGSAAPFFVLWVENAELLEPWG